MFKKLFILLLLVAAGLLIWGGFALWTGIYSVYSYLPGAEGFPNGATLLVTREAGEPMFNSPEAPAPEKKKPTKQGGIQFARPTKMLHPIAERTILELPFVKWAYEKSLEPQTDGK